MGLFTFLLILQTLVAVLMITVILMQRSEGGGLAGGGSPSGMMSARGAADFLTRSTAVLAAIFVALSIALAAVAAGQQGPRTIDPSLMEPAPGAPAAAPLADPLAPGAAPPAQQPAPAEPDETGVPLAQ